MTVLLTAGGPVMWTIAIVGAAATVIFFMRLVDLRRAHVDYADFMAGVENLILKNNDREALAICDDTPAPVARVVAAALRRRGSSPSAIKDAADAAARTETRRFSRRLSVLQTIAQTSPLLGLFGTVVGFAESLAAVASRQLVSRSEILSMMAPALACAAAGLLVAVLVHVMHALLRARLEHLVADLDAATGDIQSRLGGAGS